MDCDKITYNQYKDAFTQIKSLTTRQKRHKFSVYKCPLCGKFHVTTITKHTLHTPKKLDKYPIKYELPKKEPVKETKKKKFYNNKKKQK